MDTTLDRRRFLRLSALAAAGTVVAACSGSGGGGGGGGALGGSNGGTVAVTKTDIEYVKGLSYSGKLKEAPSLSALVKQGKLPPVEQRLPQHPYVVPHGWVKEGRYGGTMQWVSSDTSDATTTNVVHNAMYGHSLLRWQHDGQQIGPGLAETWSANGDLSVWTFNFRKGLKWSDGQSWTVDDILFWYDDIAGDPRFAATDTPPQELRSGKGTPVTMKKVDDHTLEFHYDSPTPLAADYMAMWAKRMVSPASPTGVGPQMMEPKHYLSQFHPKYNPSVAADPRWLTTFQTKRDWLRNPDNPTMTGWKCKSYTTGQQVVVDRNPYYWAIDRWGNQLPYMEGITNTNYQDPQAEKLAIQQGKVDMALGAHLDTGQLTLADVSTIKQAASSSNLTVDFWDSGSGTGSMYFFNRDHQDQRYRSLFRNPKFLQAMSLAYNRANAQKTIYYDQGEITTGGMSPKAVEFHVGNGPSVYRQWRDAWSKHDPKQAEQLLDSIGLKKPAGSQWRAFPDGSPLQITIDYQSDAGQADTTKDELLAKDWQAVGINANPNPVPNQGGSFVDEWAAGKLMMYTAWEVGDGPNCLVFPNWLVPMDHQRWAPLEGQWFLLQGTPQANSQPGVDPWHRTPPNLQPDAGGPVDRLQKLYAQTTTEPDFMKRNQLVWNIMKIHYQEGPFFCGTVANYPQLVVYKNDMRNVPKRTDLKLGGFTNPWTMVDPGVHDPETWYWQNPGQH